jgi:UDPglucose 6-dehydrogenase
MAEEKGRHPQLLQAVMDINDDRRPMAVKRVKEMLGGSLKGKTIGLLGLAFKPNTDDMRDAPAIDIANALVAGGAEVCAYDPVSMNVAAGIMPAVEMCSDPYSLAECCDALMITTEWNEFVNLDFDRIRDSMKTPIIFDGRNLYDPDVMKKLGFVYRGLGRGYNGTAVEEK